MKIIDKFFNFINKVSNFIFKPSVDIIELNNGQLFLNLSTGYLEVNFNHPEVKKRILQQFDLLKTIQIK